MYNEKYHLLEWKRKITEKEMSASNRLGKPKNESSVILLQTNTKYILNPTEARLVRPGLGPL